jgi:hypothetical protein
MIPPSRSVLENYSIGDGDTSAVPLDPTGFGPTTRRASEVGINKIRYQSSTNTSKRTTPPPMR